MKKSLFTLFIISFCIITQAQQHSLGFKLGANISNMTANGSSSDRKPGLLVGLASEIKVVQGFSICPELYYSQQGYSFTTSSSSSGSFSVNYINIPLLFRGSFGSENARFYINAGPQLGVYVNGSASSGSASASMPENYITSTDFSGVIGIGTGIKAGNGEFIIDVRYSAGLSNVAGTALKSWASSQGLSSIELKNNVIGISIGYMFYLTPTNKLVNR